MSVIPFIFDNTPKFLDQYFGRDMDMDDFFDAAMLPFIPQDFWEPWKSDLAVTDKEFGVKSDDDKYQVSVDVQQFAPEEITVKTVGREIVVEAKHEENNDKDGFVSRNFVRKYVLPGDYKPEDVISSLSSDGVLSITAPRVTLPTIEGERTLAINHDETLDNNHQHQDNQKMQQ